MSPALALAWSVVGFSVALIALSEFVSVAQGTIRVLLRLSPSVARIATVVLTAVLLIGLVRPSRSAAVTPPPSDRIVLMTSESDDEIALDRQALFVLPPGLLSSPTPSSSAVHTVVRGDSLWAIARERLERSGLVPTGTEITDLWRSIYAANTGVIGDDPNLILPGQLLVIPAGPHG